MSRGNANKISRQNVEYNPPEGRRQRTDLGIEILHRISHHRARWTLDEIALFCGCTESAILLIEQKALRKLRKRLDRDPHLAELFNCICY